MPTQKTSTNPKQTALGCGILVVLAVLIGSCAVAVAGGGDKKPAAQPTTMRPTKNS